MFLHLKIERRKHYEIQLYANSCCHIDGNHARESYADIGVSVNDEQDVIMVISSDGDTLAAGYCRNS